MNTLTDATSLFVAEKVSLWAPQATDRRVDPILKQMEFDVPQESVVTIIGSSGSGKSTLLRLFCRFRTPDEGRLLYKGRDLRDWDVLHLRKEVRMVFQTPTMLDGTVLDNLTTANPPQSPAAIDWDWIHTILDSLGLSRDLIERSAHDLSGGQKARVALGRALYDRPPVLLCDELTASLDLESKRLMEEFVLHYQRTHKATCFWITHDLQQARTMGTLTWMIDRGELVESAATETFFAHPQHTATQKLLHELHEQVVQG